MFFRQFKVDGLGCYSYLIGCPANGTACVVDPERHVAQYITTAQENGLEITDVFDTHLHADHITAARSLRHRPALESVSIPLTGDLLFVGDVGRPDLAGEDMLEVQVRALYDSLYNKLSLFPDWTEVYPAHGEGSLCGRGMSAKPMTTLGFERRNNPLLKGLPFAQFHNIMTAGFQIRPDNFAAIVDKNRQGPKLLGQMAAFTDLSVQQVERAVENGARMVDVRAQTAFGAAFIPGAINIGMVPSSVNWLGMVLDADTDIVIVAESAVDAREAAHRFWRAGYDRLIGYVKDGVSGWALQGKSLDHFPQLPPSGFKHVPGKYRDHVVSDVRTGEEWRRGHIDGATHVPISTLVKARVEMDLKSHITTVCNSGYRSNIAASFLKSQGYEHVLSLIGGMIAWSTTQRNT